MIAQLVKFFVVFFVVVEPISLIPLFAGLTDGASDSYKRKMAAKAALIALGICVLFALAGAKFLELMGIATGANVMSRLSGVVLAALAVQFVVDGIRGSFF